MKVKLGLISASLAAVLLVGCSDDTSVEYYEKHPDEGLSVRQACANTFELNGKKLTVEQCDNALEAAGWARKNAHSSRFYAKNRSIQKVVLQACEQGETEAEGIKITPAECKNAKAADWKKRLGLKKSKGYMIDVIKSDKG